MTWYKQGITDDLFMNKGIYMTNPGKKTLKTWFAQQTPMPLV